MNLNHMPAPDSPDAPTSPLREDAVAKSTMDDPEIRALFPRPPHPRLRAPTFAESMRGRITVRDLVGHEVFDKQAEREKEAYLEALRSSKLARKRKVGHKTIQQLEEF